MSSRGAVGLFWAMLALVALPACTQTRMPAETSAALCTNALDDDGDELDDCKDPDCWGHELCRLTDPEGVLPPPYQPPPYEPPPEMPVVDSGHVMPPVDGPEAGTPEPTPDAGVPKTPDAEQPDEPCVCADGACSDAGVCETDPTPLGRFVVFAIDVNVPRSRGLACFDHCIEDVIPGLCACLPDPQVLIFVDGEKAGSVKYEEDVEEVRWTDLTIQLVISDGSHIGLNVVDNDGAEAEPIFECELTANPELLASGQLRCESEDLLPGRRRIVAHLEPLDPPED